MSLVRPGRERVEARYGGCVLDTVSIDGRRICVDSVGTGPPLVALPGGPGFPGAQLAELGGLSAVRTLCRVDWRGAGTSDPPADGRHGLDDYAADLARLQDHLGLERIDLLGHSFGGMVAARYAARHPGRVGRLVLDATPDVPGDGRAPVGGMAGYFARWQDTTRSYLESVMETLYEPAGAWFEQHEYAVADVRPDLARIEAPTLVVTGDSDWAVGPARALAMADSLDVGRAEVIADAGHFACVENPEAWVAVVADFLAGPGPIRDARTGPVL